MQLGQCKESAQRERERESQEIEDQRRESQQKEDPGAQNVKKVAKRYDFQCFGVPGGPKVGSLQPRVRSHLAR